MTHTNQLDMKWVEKRQGEEEADPNTSSWSVQRATFWFRRPDVRKVRHFDISYYGSTGKQGVVQVLVELDYKW